MYVRIIGVAALAALGLHYGRAILRRRAFTSPQGETVRLAVAKKQRAREAAKACRPPERSSTSSLPPGQRRVDKWVVMDLGLRPPASYSLDRRTWALTFVGERGTRASLSVAELEALGVRRVEGHDWHCITSWSACGLEFGGVPFEAVLQHPKVAAIAPSDWSWLLQTSADGYTVPVAREDAQAAGVFFALSFGGEPITLEHGGPRIVFPQLYGWKSAKWLVEVHLSHEYRAGFWEATGKCHPRGRVALNERFKESALSDMWTWLYTAPARFFPRKVYDGLLATATRVGAVVGSVLLRRHSSSRRQNNC